MTAFDELTRLVPPPAAPVDARGDWHSVEAELGLALPADFKQLIEAYGLGQFVDFITPLTPFGSRDLLMRSARDILDSEHSFREENPEDSPYAIYPEPGGLLEWAGTDNGDRLCWLTEGEPDQWTTIAWNQRSWSYDVFPVGAVEFLAGWLAGRIETTVFSPREPDQPAPWFDPYRELKHVYIKLDYGRHPYSERLRILRNALAPTLDRRAYDNGDVHQDHFAAPEHGWRLTYETAYGHQIRIAYPPDDEAKARAVILDAVERMGCEVLKITTHRGEPAWT
ncbi:SMI1/KNR4 family protein [Actinospica sp. MGRD01-02]|uniref:SMI1/KNR4 family protein n=1 Tax=Actinospica acidithermotolerans TaxID=2828514 RepID=A0A941IKA9_9ACTN|nr:SMI1/KNR4 family protein [Actinospica acidithermotolerans]MBR7827938.1 SMI1/KNR4 family protein [Actinospica acidithermotolerans]